jgi:hypothetical protein
VCDTKRRTVPSGYDATGIEDKKSIGELDERRVAARPIHPRLRIDGEALVARQAVRPSSGCSSAPSRVIGGAPPACRAIIYEF